MATELTGHIGPVPPRGREIVVLTCAKNRVVGNIVNGRYLTMRCRDRLCRHPEDRGKSAADCKYDVFHRYDLALGGKRLLPDDYRIKGGADATVED